MMHSITNDRAKTDNGTKYTGIRILAVLFWIAIWQFASMYLKQEILLASPVSVVQKLFELIFSRNFWYSVGFSFVRIVTGFLLAVFLGNLSGNIGILVKNSGNPDSTCDRSGQIYTCGILYYFVPDMDSFEKSVSFYFLSYGSAGDIYKYP